jgi:hypothetical protein
LREADERRLPDTHRRQLLQLRVQLGRRLLAFASEVTKYTAMV